MSKRSAARLGDIGDRHGKHPPTPIMAGSASVLINGRPAARQGDQLVPHKHGRTIAGGTAGVLIDGRPLARVGDPIDCGGKIITGAGNVLVGEAPQLPPVVARPEI